MHYLFLIFACASAIFCGTFVVRVTKSSSSTWIRLVIILSVMTLHTLLWGIFMNSLTQQNMTIDAFTGWTIQSLFAAVPSFARIFFQLFLEN